MKPLLRQLTRFVQTALELYAPLPFDFTADLHTLNAYLRSYCEAEEKLLENFVNRLADKLGEKMHSQAVKDVLPLPTCTSESHENVLRHYSSCTFKYPELKLTLDANEEFNSSQALQEKPVYSQRSGRNEQGGIKGNRHKFGSRHRSKLNGDISIDKENLSYNFNTDHSQDKSLKGIKSEMDLGLLENRKKSADVSLKRDEGRGKTRYESNESRNNNTSSLKIKLKPKPSIDIQRLREGLQATLELFSRQDQQMMELMESLLEGEELGVC